MKLIYVVEVEPIIPPNDDSLDWAEKYYGGIIKQYLEWHFKELNIYKLKNIKRKKEILEEIESLKKSRDSFVVDTMEWNIFNYAIVKLEWVIEK